MPSQMLTRWAACVIACGAVALLTGVTAWAQPVPGRPIRFVVPYAAGGGTDVLARVIAEKVSADWNVPVIVENKPGAAGRIGTEAVARAAPDGHTVLMAINSHALNASLFASLPYDPIKDFSPLMLLAVSPNVLTVPAASPLRSVKEIVEAAKASPGKLTYASGGPASGSNLAGELFKLMAEVNITEVPYKGASQAMADLLGGQVSMSFIVLATASPQIAAGKLRALAVTSAARSALAPDIPTVAESGLAGYDVYSWYGALVPAGTPAAAVQQWNAELAKVLAMPEVTEKLRSLGMEARGGTPQHFARFIDEDWKLWDKVVKRLGIRLE